jgi:uncharacterized protein (TIGR03546 family)
MFSTFIVKILKIINANTKPAHVAGGIAFAMLLTLVPAGNLLWILLLALTFFLKINTTMLMIFLVVFKLLAPALSDLIHGIGYHLLTLQALQEFFTLMANMSIVPFFKFQCTRVAGGLVLGVLLWLPVFSLVMLVLRLYRRLGRETIAKRILSKKMMELPLVAKFLSLYQKTGTSTTDPASLRQNRGMIRTGKLIILAAILAGILLSLPFLSTW